MPDTTGEICVSGTAVTLGYYNNREKTDQAFVQNPLNDKYNEIIYRTGDLGYYSKAGELYFSSRKDFQIKHMGYRIELGEVEAAAGAASDVKSCVSIYDEVRDRIVLFYEGGPKNENQMRVLLEGKLPPYMRPGECIRVKRMPENANGKIDRKYLKSYYTDLMDGQAIG